MTLASDARERTYPVSQLGAIATQLGADLARLAAERAPLDRERYPTSRAARGGRPDSSLPGSKISPSTPPQPRRLITRARQTTFSRVTLAEVTCCRMHRRQSSSKAPSPTVISFPPAPPNSSDRPPLGPGADDPITPRTAYAEAFVAAAPSPQLGYGASRRKSSFLAVPSPSRFAHAHRRVLLRLGLVLLTLAALYKAKAHEHRYVEHAVGRATEHSCRALPYLARCLSRDPFKGLAYPAAGEGELAWPARRTAEGGAGGGGGGGEGRSGGAGGSESGAGHQPHPIHLLIREGRVKWEAKVERQSRTLEEAVSEYKRRYNKNPPRGFDKW